MKVYISLLLTIVVFGCAATPRDVNIQAIAVQAFGSDRNLFIHEVIYPERYVISTSQYGGWSGGFESNNAMALWSDMQLGAIQECNLAVGGPSSSGITSMVIYALYQGSGIKKLPHLRFLFIGDAKDAEIIRPKVEATGAKFYFHQR